MARVKKQTAEAKELEARERQMYGADSVLLQLARSVSVDDGMTDGLRMLTDYAGREMLAMARGGMALRHPDTIHNLLTVLELADRIIKRRHAAMLKAFHASQAKLNPKEINSRFD